MERPLRHSRAPQGTEKGSQSIDGMTSRHTSAAVPLLADPLVNRKQCALFKVINIWEMLFGVRVGFFIVIVLNWIQVLLWVSCILFIIHVIELN